MTVPSQAPTAPASVEGTVPGTATEQVSAQQVQQTEPPVPLTIEDVQREATRIAQSMVAKGENRINQSIREQIDALNKSKDILGLTPQQVDQARQKIVTEAYTAAAQPEQPAEQPVNLPDPNQFLDAQLKVVYQEVGTTIEASDPEAAGLQATIEAVFNDPNGLTKILFAAQKAAAAKATRLQQRQETAGARVVSGGGQQTTTDPNDISGITDSKELYRLGEKRISGKK